MIKVGACGVCRTDLHVIEGDGTLGSAKELSYGLIVDINGRVLGINDVIFTNSGDNAGVGFAISIDLAKIVADQITSGRPAMASAVSIFSIGVTQTGQPGPESNLRFSGRMDFMPLRKMETV